MMKHLTPKIEAEPEFGGTLLDLIQGTLPYTLQKKIGTRQFSLPDFNILTRLN